MIGEHWEKSKNDKCLACTHACGIKSIIDVQLNAVMNVGIKDCCVIKSSESLFLSVMKNNTIMAVATGAQLTSALTEKLKSKTTKIKSSSKCYLHFNDI